MVWWKAKRLWPMGWIGQYCGLRLKIDRRGRALRGVTVWTLLPAFAAAQFMGSPIDKQPLAVLDGQPIYESELPPAEATQLQKMMAQVYGVELRGLHGVLDKKLIADEAKKRGVSEEELFKTEVVAKAAEPTEDEVKAYYVARQAQYKGQPYDAVKEQIREGMKGTEIKKTEVTYVQSLLQKAVDDGELVFLLTPPKSDLPVDPARMRGDAKAPITIVEFSDFSCASCKTAESTMSALLAKYPGQLKVVYRDFPLMLVHPNAQLAAEASRCAAEQGKYWEYHDVLFANSSKQGRDDLMEYARGLKLDDKQFDACLSSEHTKTEIEQDLQLGGRVGVVAAPSFFVNGVFVSGARTAADFEKIIDEELSSTKRKKSAN